MGRLSTRIALLALLCVFAHGCFIADFFKKEEPVDVTTLRQPLDGKPRVRPGVGLIVQVTTQGEKPVLMEALVDMQGYLTLSYLLREPLYCNDLDLESCRLKITAAYKQYIKDPQVTLRFAPWDTKTGVSPYGTVLVMGEVSNPGPVNVPATMDLTVTKALVAAGNLKRFGNKSKIRVSRLNADGTCSTTIVDLTEIAEKGRIDKDMLLRPGDVVNVPEIIY